MGVAIGIAGFGAAFQSRVSDLFATSDVGRQLGSSAHEFGDAVAAGGGAEAIGRAPAAMAPALQAAARTAFVDGLTDVMFVCAAVAVVGSLVGFLFIRTRDLHESARGDVVNTPDSQGIAGGAGVEGLSAAESVRSGGER